MVIQGGSKVEYCLMEFIRQEMTGLWLFSVVKLFDLINSYPLGDAELLFPGCGLRSIYHLDSSSGIRLDSRRRIDNEIT